jgi:gliding motility-associated transport system ATP-binding protein
MIKGAGMIHVENLTKNYHNICAVDHISLEIQKGEILGLLGPNGAGKTTTLRMLTGYFPPSSGTIQIQEYEIGKDALAIKQMIGYLPEFAPIYNGMLVYDYLNYIANIRGIPAGKKLERIHELAQLCSLKKFMHRAIGELSKGLKQRVGLAHAMMSDPEILILDEPTSGLDPNQIIEIREIIRRIGKQKTIVLSTHILSEAEATCDRIVIINKGKIVADGRTETLTRANGAESCINLALANADMDSVTPVLQGIEGVKDIQCADSSDGTCLNVKVNCSATRDLRQTLYERIKSTEWIILELYQETKTLEAIFRELTREN